MAADAARQYVSAGLADEIVFQLAPVLRGGGTRLFDHLMDWTINLAAVDGRILLPILRQNGSDMTIR